MSWGARGVEGGACDRCDDLFRAGFVGVEDPVDAAVAQDDDPVGDGAHIGDGVADEDDAESQIAQARNMGEYIGRLRHGEGCGGFVEDDEARIGPVPKQENE